MTTLAVLALLLIGLLAVGLVLVPNRTSWPASSVLTPSEIQGLSPSENARLETWSRDVEALGFRRFGEYRAEVPLGPDDASPRLIQQLRAWRSPDGRERALAIHVAVVRRSPGAPFSTRLMQFAFESRRQDGTFHVTHDCAPLDDRMLRPPGWTARVAHGLGRAEALLALHRQVRPADAIELGADLPSDAASVWAWKTGYALDRGFLRREGDLLRATPRLGLRHAAGLLNPFLHESGSRVATALKLGGLVLLTLAGAAAVGAPPAPIWALPSLFAATGIFTAALIPNSALFSAVHALLPAGLLLESAGHATGWAWAAGAFATALTMSFRQRLDYRATARRMGLPAAGPPPLGRAARAGWALAFAGAIAAAAAAAWVGRRPLDGTWMLPLALLLSAPGAILLALITSLLSYDHRLRVTSGFRILRLASLCLLLPALGTVAGFALANVDRRKNEDARAAIHEALGRHRSERGAYPERLEALTPDYLPALPRARHGWGEGEFHYEGPSLHADGYRLAGPGEGP